MGATAYWAMVDNERRAFGRGAAHGARSRASAVDDLTGSGVETLRARLAR